jgi:toxin ParE1/3/4
VADLTAIRDFIASDSPANAAAFVERLLEAIERLDFFPDRGRRVPEAPELPDVRELLIDPYRVIYRQRGERVEIVMIIHGRRNLRLVAPPW